MKATLFAQARMPALLLRAGLGIVLLYAAISSLANPEDWVGYLPDIVTDAVDADVLLKLFSMYQLGLVVWLLSGWRQDLAGLVCAATFAAVIVSNISLFQITFRDVAILFAALALASLTWGEKSLAANPRT